MLVPPPHPTPTIITVPRVQYRLCSSQCESWHWSERHCEREYHGPFSRHPPHHCVVGGCPTIPVPKHPRQSGDGIEPSWLRLFLCVCVCVFVFLCLSVFLVSFPLSLVPCLCLCLCLLLSLSLFLRLQCTPRFFIHCVLNTCCLKYVVSSYIKGTHV